MPIYLALLLLVAAFACGWGISTLRQKSIIREQIRAQERARAIGELFRYAPNTIEVAPGCTVWVAKRSSAIIASEKLN